MSENDNPAPSPAPSRAEVIRQIAQALEERRKLRGLTIEKVSQTLKIRLPYLQAMERGEWDQLPGEVYVRGFIKRYATFLGLDADKLMAPYLSQTGGDVAPHGEETAGVPASDVSRSTLVWLAVLALFVIGLVRVFHQENAAPLTPPPTATPTPAALATTAAPAPTAAPGASALVKHKLEVHSPFPLWLRVTADDRNFEGFIPQDATWTWTAGGRFIIRMGHSKQVTMRFDGEPVSLGENQKRVELPK